MSGRTSVAVAAVFMTAVPLSAQAGRADLRYVSPVPASITYVTTDSSSNSMSGLPTGDRTSDTYMRTVSELVLAQDGAEIEVSAELKELEGKTTTAMGDVRIDADDVPPATIRLSAHGPDPEAVAMLQPASVTGTSPANIIGSARLFSGLIRVPGRELVMGGTWVDTVTMSPAVEGQKGDMVVVTHGTYASDTVIAGRDLNVLEIRTEMIMTMSGTVHDVPTSSQVTTTAAERVLWDSGLHYPAARSGIGEVRIETTVRGITIVVNGTTRSVTTSERRN